MLFNSAQYLVLLLIAAGCYWSFKSLAIRQTILLVASLVFYASWNAAFLLLVVPTVLAHYFITRDRWGRNFRAVAAVVVLTLLLLAWYKYADFFAEGLAILMGFVGVEFTPARFNVFLPLGISFYTFQLIAYTVDVYRGKVDSEKNVLTFTTFILFFPQLVAGPICRAPELMPQLKERQKLSWDDVYVGGFMFLAGFFLKTSIGDGLAPIANVVFADPGKFSGYDNLAGVIAFSIQILADFWGYSLMALGSAQLFGIALPHNFNLPYAARNIQEFWRRWHITLSHWLRDYVYIPFGGNRKGPRRAMLNMFLTMAIGGLWHGAGLAFILWGCLHGIGLAVHKRYTAMSLRFKDWYGYPVVAWVVTMMFVAICWVLFRAPSLDVAWTIYLHMLGFGNPWFESAIPATFYEYLVLAIVMMPLLHRYVYLRSILNISEFRASALIVLLAVLSLVFFIDGEEFIYFQF